MEKNTFVKLVNINKVYSNGFHAVYDFNLDINENDFVVFVGPSGCGKSTTLRMIAGLEEISSGDLYIDGNFANYMESKQRNISMVFQNYALYPQLNVFDNMAYPLKIQHLPKEEIKQKVFHAAKILNLGAYLDVYPKQLSGGQMQRVALGRAIVKQSKLFLMDEPLSNLDAKLRVQMRSEIVKLHKNINATTIYVTHDQIEAMTMADTIVVMNKGYVQQIDKPYAIYTNPSNLFVATFIGTPPMNLIDASIDNNNLKINDNLSINLKKETIEGIAEFYNRKIKEFESYLAIVNHSAFSLVESLANKKQFNKKQNSQINDIISLLNGSSDFDNTFLPLFKSLEADSNKNDIFLKIKQEFNRFNNIVKIGVNKIKSSQTYIKKEEEIKVKEKKKPFVNLFKKKAVVSASLRLEIIETISQIIETLKNGNKKIYLGIRPEFIKEQANDILLFDGNNDAVELLGSELNVHFYINDNKVIAKLDTKNLIKPNEAIKLYVNYQDLYFFDSITGENIFFKE